MNYEISQSRPLMVQVAMNSETRHRALILLMLAAVLTLAVILVVYGWNYYLLDQSMRPFSPMHARLKPSGIIGLRLGIFGFILCALVYLYPLRKRWTWLSRQGKATHWLNFHMILGVAAPVLITFHSAGRIQGFAGMAYWTLLVLLGSGLMGRYFYTQIPRNRDAAIMGLKQLQELSRQLIDEIRELESVSDADLANLFRLPDVQEVQQMSLARALCKMIAWDLSRPVKIWSLRRRKENVHDRVWTAGGVFRSRHSDLETALVLVSKQASLAKRIVFLSKAERVFYLWHVIHRPFSLSFAFFVIVHVCVVMSLGFY